MNHTTSNNYIHGNIYDIKCSELHRSCIPTRNYICQEAMNKLGGSIKSCGLIHPITFTRRGELLEIVSGERRWQASLNAGTEFIQAKYVDRDIEEIALAENFQREDLNPLEKAELLSSLKNKYAFTHAHLAEYIGKSVPSVSELLSLNRLPEDVKAACRNSNEYVLTRLVKIAKAPGQKKQHQLFKDYQQELSGENIRGELRRDQNDITKLAIRLDRIFADILKVETEHMSKKDLLILFSKFSIGEQVMNKIASEYSGIRLSTYRNSEVMALE